MAVTATDAWSSVGVPTWTFGDGGTGTGASVHARLRGAGHLHGARHRHRRLGQQRGQGRRRDRSPPRRPRSRAPSSPASGRSAASRARSRWPAPRRAPAPTRSTCSRARRARSTSSSTLPRGAFTQHAQAAGEVPAGHLQRLARPGRRPGEGRQPHARASPAPASGVVDVAFLSGARNGTAARTLTGASTIWASFHFAAKPKGKLTLTWYRIGKKRVRLGATSKDSAVKVVSYLRIAQDRSSARYQAVLSRKGVVIARASVRAKG